MKNFIYRLRLDYDDKYRDCNSLKETFNILRDNGHITLLDMNTSKAEFLQKAESTEIDSEKYQVYVETSISNEGDFYESIDFWIQNYLLDEFYCLDHRPYIEVLVDD